MTSQERPAVGPLPDRAPPERSTAPQSPAMPRQIATGGAIAALIVGTIAVLAAVV